MICQAQKHPQNFQIRHPNYTKSAENLNFYFPFHQHIPALYLVILPLDRRIWLKTIKRSCDQVAGWRWELYIEILAPFRYNM